MTPRIKAAFETLGTAPHAHRFCLWTEPARGTPTGLVVYVHPFAEEMNKSRRMAALQARAFAMAGAVVLQFDLLGCGDSAGDSGDATWSAWVDDVVAACQAARDRFTRDWPGQGVPPLWLWGLRAGCLLGVEAASRLTEPCHFVFWQPALVGKASLQQFLRLDSVGAAIGGNAGASAREPARTLLAAGRAAHVAGYTVDPALASGLERARLTPPTHIGRVLWFDVSTQPLAEPFPATRQAQTDWQQAGFVLQAGSVVGAQFWQTTEIEDAPALIGATLAAWAAASETAAVLSEAAA